jgi:RNA polymerase sigma factor (sigma-70 family)
MTTRSPRLAITPDAERDLIAAAQQGDKAAMAELFRGYEDAINTAASRFTHRLGADDAKQAAAIGFLAAVNAFDSTRGGNRLAVLMNTYLTEELWAAVADNGIINVPARTLRRYFQIMRAAGDDLSRAEELAPKYDMRAATFAAVAAAVNPGLSYDTEYDRPSHDRHADVEDQILSRAALAACSPDERAVLELHYGIGSYETTPLPEVAVQLGMSVRLVRKLHASGLAAAREALGAL